MARNRMIKPEFFTSEQIVECSTSARLLFVGIWCFSDDQGVHPASIKRLKMEVFPSDPITDNALRKMVDELLRVGLLAEFEVENQRFWAVTGWKKHQKIDRPSYRYPTPPSGIFDESSSSIRRGFDEHSSSARPETETERNSDQTPVVPKSKPAPKSRTGRSDQTGIQGIDSQSLKDTGAVLRWLADNATALGVNPASDVIQREILACAEHTLASGKKPAGLFVTFAKQLAAGKRPSISAEAEDRAKSRHDALRRSCNGNGNPIVNRLAGAMTTRSAEENGHAE